ncbi:enoyl-CoA hydratase-related protein [Lentilitoribacter sp. Alg239-R112]|uniref:enoyl-CoA hydratase-related protein n=1 Tax=Lentilitoribacter sp. Alg239-R112 TaxID=2305987 RepID=UPI0013A6AD4B|nr:enoyl-CoA hydratase-related protein [Lentilitoribacter sp. Alg239-R112]
MSDFNTISLLIDECGIAYLTLNRAEKHNAMNAEMLLELTAAAELCANDENVRAVVLKAEGKSFCAGGDLDWMREQAGQNREGKMAAARILASALMKLNTLPKPLIGRVQGNAFGGGIGLMAVCDLVIAHPAAKYGLTETKLGLVPATIGPFVVERMGGGFARQVFFSGRGFNSDFALRSGLVTKVTEDLDEAIDAELKTILKTAPGAVADAKLLCQNLSSNITPTQIESTIAILADRWESEETKLGIDAFFNKRLAPWVR